MIRRSSVANEKANKEAPIARHIMHPRQVLILYLIKECDQSPIGPKASCKTSRKPLKGSWLARLVARKSLQGTWQRAAPYNPPAPRSVRCSPGTGLPWAMGTGRVTVFGAAVAALFLVHVAEGTILTARTSTLHLSHYATDSSCFRCDVEPSGEPC